MKTFAVICQLRDDISLQRGMHAVQMCANISANFNAHVEPIHRYRFKSELYAFQIKTRKSFLYAARECGEHAFDGGHIITSFYRQITEMSINLIKINLAQWYRLLEFHVIYLVLLFGTLRKKEWRRRVCSAECNCVWRLQVHFRREKKTMHNSYELLGGFQLNYHTK